MPFSALSRVGSLANGRSHNHMLSITVQLQIFHQGHGDDRKRLQAKLPVGLETLRNQVVDLGGAVGGLGRDTTSYNAPSKQL